VICKISAKPPGFVCGAVPTGLADGRAGPAKLGPTVPPAPELDD